MKKKNVSQKLSWRIKVPLVSNNLVFKSVTTFVVITGLVMSIFLGFIFIAIDEFDALIPMLSMIGIVTFGLWIFMQLIMLVLFGNTMKMYFQINKNGVKCNLESSVSRLGNRVSVILGFMARNPSVAGSGILAMSQESVQYDWDQIKSAKYYDKKQAISLRNSWRELIVVYATAENYEKTKKFVQSKIKKQDKKKINPVFLFIVRSFLVFLACLPLFKTEFPIEIDLLISIIILTFSLATVWLIPLFGYVVIVGVIYVIGDIFVDGLRVYESSLSFIPAFSGFELLDETDWVALSLLSLGMLYLFIMSIRAIKGYDESALMKD